MRDGEAESVFSSIAETSTMFARSAIASKAIVIHSLDLKFKNIV